MSSQSQRILINKIFFFTKKHGRIFGFVKCDYWQNSVFHKHVHLLWC